MAATIHQIRRPDAADDPNFDWSYATTENFFVYDGYGNHDEMVIENAEKNAKIIEKILKNTWEKI